MNNAAYMALEFVACRSLPVHPIHTCTLYICKLNTYTHTHIHTHTHTHTYTHTRASTHMCIHTQELYLNVMETKQEVHAKQNLIHLEAIIPSSC